MEWVLNPSMHARIVDKAIGPGRKIPGRADCAFTSRASDQCRQLPSHNQLFSMDSIIRDGAEAVNGCAARQRQAHGAGVTSITANQE